MTDNENLCERCELPVSMKGKKRLNRTRRLDGGWNHIECANAGVACQLIKREERREQRDAVRIAILREDRLA